MDAADASGSAVGEPGRGAAVLAQMAAAQGRGRATAAPPQEPQAGRGNAATAAIPFGGVDPVYVVGSDGYLHTLLSSNGADSEARNGIPASQLEALRVDLR